MNTLYAYNVMYIYVHMHISYTHIDMCILQYIYMNIYIYYEYIPYIYTIYYIFYTCIIDFAIFTRFPQELPYFCC